jgi:hypothetical protein
MAFQILGTIRASVFIKFGKRFTYKEVYTDSSLCFQNTVRVSMASTTYRDAELCLMLGQH